MLGGGNNNISKIYSSRIQVLQNIFYNSLYFFNNNKAYQWEDAISFFSSFSYFPYYYMNKWIEATDEEANRLLKSQQFLDNFREYIKSIIKYEKFLKEESNNNPFFSINDLDK